MAEVPAQVSMIFGRLKRVAFEGFLLPERVGCVLYHLWNQLIELGGMTAPIHHHIVGDDAFHLRVDMMKPYPTETTTEQCQSTTTACHGLDVWSKTPLAYLSTGLGYF